MARATPPDIAWTEAWGVTRPTGRDRREAERVIAYWEDRLHELGGEATVTALDLAGIDTVDWSNRFLISIDPVIERSALLLYGPKFAQLLGLPAQPRLKLPLMRQLPGRYADLFLRGCTEARKQAAPVRLAGEIERTDDRIEQYRAAFIPVGVKPNSLTLFAFGAFSNRVIQTAANG